MSKNPHTKDPDSLFFRFYLVVLVSAIMGFAYWVFFTPPIAGRAQLTAADAADVTELIHSFAKENPEFAKALDSLAETVRQSLAPDKSPISAAPRPPPKISEQLRDEIARLQAERDGLNQLLKDQQKAVTLVLREYVRLQEEAHKWDGLWGFFWGVVSSLVANWIWIKTRKNGERELA